MYFFWLLAATLAVASRPYHPPPTSPGGACSILKREYRNGTFYPGDVGYTNATEAAWSTTCWLGPACVFAPSNAEQLSFAVKTLSKLGTKFSMRGGGHMAIATASNIDSHGVLISSINLNALELSVDNRTLSVGPGLRWGKVYEELEGTGLAVVGARLGPVGVPGVLLGGGVSFYSYEYGLASTNGNIKAYECVLADGSIVESTADNKHADLFWALQGGGNSFCIVTRFDLQTYHAPNVMFGVPSYGSSEVAEDFIDSVYHFATSGHVDPKGSIIPVAQFVSGQDGPDYASTLFYNGDQARPRVLQDFLGQILTPLDGSDTLIPYSLGQYSRDVRPAFEKGGFAYGLRQRFHLIPVIANREAIKLLHDEFFKGALDTFNDTEGGTIGLAFNPITSKLLSATNAKPGSLQGLDETPAFWFEQVYSWKNAEDDQLVDDFIKFFNSKMLKSLDALNATGSFYYLNEADEGQPVFESYPPENLKGLRKIRQKYDPKRIFTDLMPGGFKVDAG